MNGNYYLNLDIHPSYVFVWYQTGEEPGPVVEEGGTFFMEVTSVANDGAIVTTPVRRSRRLADPPTPSSVRKALEQLLISES